MPVPSIAGPIACASCDWRGTVEETDLPPGSEYLEQIGLADRHLHGIVLLPSGQCPECGCFAYDDDHCKTFDLIVPLLEHVANNPEVTAKLTPHIPGAQMLRLFRREPRETPSE